VNNRGIMVKQDESSVAFAVHMRSSTRENSHMMIRREKSVEYLILYYLSTLLQSAAVAATAACWPNVFCTFIQTQTISELSSRG
jgi:hypothetical protein